MAWAGKASDFLARASNNNIVINTCLVGAFALLSARSMMQQTNIESLENEKNSLAKANKDMKKTMWDWKQQLFAEASVDGSSIPLSTVKAIYGEAPTQPGVTASEASKPTPKKFIV